MNRLYQRWYSPALQRDMELLVFGHAGARLLAFPTSQKRFYEWEDNGMVAALAEPLERGFVQLVCVDGVDNEGWYAWGRHPAERARRQVQYDAYVGDEVLPFMRTVNDNPYLIVAGASFGAYQAVNFAFRRPEAVGRVLGFSGIYDIRRFADGYYDEAVYFNNPVDFLAGEHDPGRLAALRRLDVTLAVGRGDPLIASNERLSHLLCEKGIPHKLRLWDGFAHDWPDWQRMLLIYIGGGG